MLHVRARSSSAVWSLSERAFQCDPSNFKIALETTHEESLFQGDCPAMILCLAFFFHLGPPYLCGLPTLVCPLRILSECFFFSIWVMRGMRKTGIKWGRGMKRRCCSKNSYCDGEWEGWFVSCSGSLFSHCQARMLICPCLHLYASVNFFFKLLTRFVRRSTFSQCPGSALQQERRSTTSVQLMPLVSLTPGITL